MLTSESLLVKKVQLLSVISSDSAFKIRSVNVASSSPSAVTMLSGESSLGYGRVDDSCVRGSAARENEYICQCAYLHAYIYIYT